VGAQQVLFHVVFAFEGFVADFALVGVAGKLGFVLFIG
jgi:hypothetical protein